MNHGLKFNQMSPGFQPPLIQLLLQWHMGHIMQHTSELQWLQKAIVDTHDEVSNPQLS